MKRRGIVLFITLGMMLLLSTIVLLFLRQSGLVQKSVRQDSSLVQTDLLLQNMGNYLKSFTLSPEDLFYGADIPVAMEMGNLHATMTLSSAQNRIDINAVLQAIQKNQEELDHFIEWLRLQKVRRPEVLLALFLDTMDKDLYPRGRDTEIKIFQPRFQNGSITNRRALATVLRTYRLLTGDTNQRIEKWSEIFGFEKKRFDLNYATYDQLTLLYPDWPSDTLRRIAAHNSYYKAVDDLPVAEELRSRATLPRFGITPTLKTLDTTVSVSLKTPNECQTTLSFRMNLKSKRIDRLGYSPIRCE